MAEHRNVARRRPEEGFPGMRRKLAENKTNNWWLAMPLLNIKEDAREETQVLNKWWPATPSGRTS